MRDNQQQNGHGLSSNGSPARSDRCRSGQDEEIVRLMIQALGDMGYTSAVQALSQESGVKIESALVEDFRRAILTGDWSSAEEALSELELTDPSNASVGPLVHTRADKMLTMQRKSYSSCVNKSFLNYLKVEVLRQHSSLSARNCLHSIIISIASIFYPA